MKVLDLFSGLGGWSQAFRDRGYDVVTVDIEQRFNPTICEDVMKLTPKDFNQYGKFDIILASPPCNCFSIASITSHWLPDYVPKENTKSSIKLVNHTIDLINKLNPRWWIMENPRGMLRKVIGNPQATITMCQYGDNRMKITDLWGNLPAFEIRRCKNNDRCHVQARRGAKTGTQGLKTSEERAKIPYGLSLAVCLACEKDLEEVVKGG